MVSYTFAYRTEADCMLDLGFEHQVHFEGLDHRKLKTQRVGRLSFDTGIILGIWAWVSLFCRPTLRCARSFSRWLIIHNSCVSALPGPRRRRLASTGDHKKSQQGFILFCFLTER